MKTSQQGNVKKTRNPLLGMLIAVASICGFLAFLVLITVAMHFIMM